MLSRSWILHPIQAELGLTIRKEAMDAKEASNAKVDRHHLHGSNVVTIVYILGDKVRLGIEAPNDVPVHRQEVYEAIQRENRKANQVQPSDLRSLKEKGS